MNNKWIVLIAVLEFAACKNARQIPDTSAIAVNAKIERFDRAFFALDSNNTGPGLKALYQQFPYFTNDFLVNILGTAPLSDTGIAPLLISRRFLSTYHSVNDSLQMKFQQTDWLEKELQKGLKLVKYYFPRYTLPPKIVTYIGPFDAPGVAITRFTLAIGLQLYAGRNFSFYKSDQGQEMYPAYISRRFESEYITSNCMMSFAQDLFQDESGNRPLIEQMIQKGKYWWLVNQFLPETADSLITGFSEKQLGWCKVNEGLIWNLFLQNDLFSIDPDVIKNFIGEGPSTQGMPDASPGNIGQWVGWQIVQEYVRKNPTITPEQLMRTDAKKIFGDTKYKPK